MELPRSLEAKIISQPAVGHTSGGCRSVTQVEVICIAVEAEQKRKEKKKRKVVVVVVGWGVEWLMGRPGQFSACGLPWPRI